MISSNRKHELLKFMLVGGVAALVHYLLYLLFLWLGVPDEVSYLIALAIGIVVNFIGSTFFTFRRRPTLQRMIKFALSNGINIFNHALLFSIFINLEVSPKLCPVFVYTLAFPLNFLLVKYAIKGKSIKRGQNV